MTRRPITSTGLRFGRGNKKRHCERAKRGTPCGTFVTPEGSYAVPQGVPLEARNDAFYLITESF